MTDTARRLILVLATTALAVGLAACGGSGGSTGAPASTATGAASQEPSAAAGAPASAAPAGAGAAGGVCDLVTADELAAAFAVASVSTTVIAGPPDTCVVESDVGRPLASWSHTTSGAGAIYGGVVMPGQSTEVSGIGDKAAFVDNMGFLVLKGDSMVVITIASGADLDEAAGQDVAKQLGALVAGRM